MYDERTVKRFWSKADKNGPLYTDTQTGETTHCWIWTGKPDPQGYGRFQIGNQNLLAHRISFEICHNESLGEFHALHRCDNPPCINPTHLFKGTHQDNMRDRDAKGRNTYYSGDDHWTHKHPERLARGERNGKNTHPESRGYGENHWSHKHPDKVVKGEHNGSSKITLADVQAIRELHRQGLSLAAIARLKNLSDTHVGRIVKGENWSD